MALFEFLVDVTQSDDFFSCTLTFMIAITNQPSLQTKYSPSSGIARSHDPSRFRITVRKALDSFSKCWLPSLWNAASSPQADLVEQMLEEAYRLHCLGTVDVKWPSDDIRMAHWRRR